VARQHLVATALKEARMRAVQFDLADPSFPASLVELDEPALPRGDWARVEVTACGICGSDLHLFSHNIGDTPALVPLAKAFPFVLGHELAGRVIEAGPDCPVPVGTRVAVNPDLSCVARGIDPVCPACAMGSESSCHNVDSEVVTPGMSIGMTSGLGGGWAEQVLAHTSMLHPVPESVPERAASLHEPLSIAVHGLLRRPPEDGVPVIVFGGAIIGLAVVAATRAVFPRCDITVVARHDAQARAATAVGAHRVVRSTDDRSHFEELAEASGARLSGAGDQAMLIGGFPYVVDAVGYPATVTESLRAVGNRGTVLLLGAASTVDVDLSPVWWKETSLVGAVNHAHDAGPDGHRHSIDRALDILGAGGFPHDAVITQEFGLDAHREAIETALDRAAGAIKVVFRPNG
jgi:threonine dehydrogenase-like Zn-dependent dehydrogenase